MIDDSSLNGKLRRLRRDAWIIGWETKKNVSLMIDKEINDEAWGCFLMWANGGDRWKIENKIIKPAITKFDWENPREFIRKVDKGGISHPYEEL
jgi:hypothetical protein